MSPVPIQLRPVLAGAVASAAILLAVSAQADQTLGNDPFREKDPGFFHRASNDVGNFFKRLFGTDEEKHPQKKAPAPKKNRSTGQRYNLDHPPEEVRDTAASSNRAGSTTSKADAADSGTRPKSPARSPSRGTTLLEEPPKPKPKPQKPASGDSGSPAASTDAASQSGKSRKPADAASGSAGEGTVLYSNTGTANARPPEPAAKTRTETTVKTPKAPSDPPSVLTGTKTGKLGRVKSPYAPYSELDVTGLPSGSLALDPTTQKVFRIP